MAEKASSESWVETEVPVPGGSLAAEVLRTPGSGPGILLLGGASWSRDWWPDAFCRALHERGLTVIRFDARDTGASVASPPGHPDYSADDLADDAVAVLDACGIDRAVLVGLSLGGGLAQRIAATHHDRVAGLVLMSTSPAGEVGVDLPGPTDAILAAFEAEPPEPDWTDHEATVAWLVESERPYAGPGMFDEDAIREIAERVSERSPSLASGSNHFLIAQSAGEIELDDVRGIPTLVVHGSDDGLFPPAHGEALTAALGARMLLLPGVGHQLAPAAMWPTIVDAIAELIAAAD